MTIMWIIMTNVDISLKDMANVMNALYMPLNIYVALTGVVVWTHYDEIEMVTDGDRMLTNFLHYRKVNEVHSQKCQHQTKFVSL